MRDIPPDFPLTPGQQRVVDAAAAGDRVQVQRERSAARLAGGDDVVGDWVAARLDLTRAET